MNTQLLGSPAPVSDFPEPRRPARMDGQLLRLRVEHPTTLSVTVLVQGEVDLRTAPELAKLLTHHLRGAVSVVVVDLSDVTFLGTAGIRVLHEACLLSQQQAIRLSIVVSGSRPARRALKACGLDRVPHISDRPTSGSDLSPASPV